MNHLRWMGHSTTIMDIQRNLRFDTDTCEVTLATKDQNIKAHRFVLSSCSEFLKAALADLPIGEECTLIIPDINGYLLESIVSFIYMGETNLGSTHLTEFLEAINVLGIKSAISFEFSSCNMETTAEVTQALEESLKSLTDIQMAQVDIIEEETEDQQKISENVAEPTSDGRALEFYDVYTEPQTKIGYAIEHIPTTSQNQFIITGTTGTYTLTSASKIESSAATADNSIEELETDEIESQLIEEEYSNVNDQGIEVSDNLDTEMNDDSSITMENSKLNIKSMRGGGSMSDPNDSIEDNDNKIVNSTMKKEDVSMNFSESVSYDGYSSGNDFKLTKNMLNLDLAVHAVINEGYSLAKAANKHDVSKTVLWRRVRKNPNYMKHARENPIFTEAYARLSNGESLKSVSKDLDIPMSTLHRHKVRLSQEGRLPKYINVRKRELMSKEELKERLAKAVSACVHDGMSQNQAANIFNIPKSTLWRHLQRRVTEAESQLGSMKKEEEILS